MIINFKPSIKQDLIFKAFDDTITTEILFGGSAGGGKSYAICSLLIIKALQYPGIRIGLARNELTTLKKTTIVSFFEVATNWGLTTDMFTYNSTAGTIKFFNDSEIVLIELSYKPSDPDFTRLGGQLFTFGVIDEVGEIDEIGFNIFKSRLGRWKNDELNVKPMCIMTCNPVKNWLYRNFYKPYTENKLEEYQMFIPSLVTDNPFISKAYINNLKTLPFAQRERLLMGNWDYDDDPTALLDYDSILNIWNNGKNNANKKYITADIAFTSDKCVILLWEGLTIIKKYVNPTGNLEEFILKLAQEHNVPNYHIAYDSDGVGKFLNTRLKNAKPIINNAAPFNKENYKNLKTQLYFKLCELINNNHIKDLTIDYQKEIIEELQVIRYKPTNTVAKIEMIDKGEVKRLLGRSPDFSDAMAYRMYFEYKTTGVRPFMIK